MFCRVCIGPAGGQSLDRPRLSAKDASVPARAVVAAIDMGYGHLRPAAALAGYLGTDVLQMDHPPLGDERDRKFWESIRDLYEPLTRFSQLPGVGGPMRALLNTITAIP